MDDVHPLGCLAAVILCLAAWALVYELIRVFVW